MHALDRAEDVEFLVESVLGGVVVKPAHEYGLVGVALDVLVTVWMPYTKFALVKHKTLIAHINMKRRLQAATLPGIKPR